MALASPQSVVSRTKVLFKQRTKVPFQRPLHHCYARFVSKKTRDELADRMIELVQIVGEHQALLAAICAYQVEQPTFDQSLFAALLEQERKRMRIPKVDIRETSAVLRVLLRHFGPSRD